MLVGHLAAGFTAKRLAPQVSLGTLVLAAVAADLLWCLFLIAGIEQVRILPGRTTQDSLAAINIAYSHSLAMDAVWGLLLAAGFFVRRRCARGAWILFALVLSHWLLDFMSHRPDMPLAPGVHAAFGLGLWNSIPATVAVEGGFWLVALALYARATTPMSRAGVYGFWSGVVVLTAAWWNNIAGPPPAPNVKALAISSLIFFSLVTAWAYWINRLRRGIR
jgi:hypothetical protein